MAGREALEQEYTQLLHHLLPRGPAWSDDDPLLNGLAPSLANVHLRALDLIREGDPSRTVELIDRYEKICGLPDECAPAGIQTLAQRQQRLDAKINVPGGINEQFYRNQLDALGYPDVTITQYQHLPESPNPEWGDMWRYYWGINIPDSTSLTWMTCGSECNEAIRVWGDTIIECVIDKLIPSHTIAVFNYITSENNETN